jgi:hypothetical protein
MYVAVFKVLSLRIAHRCSCGGCDPPFSGTRFALCRSRVALQGQYHHCLSEAEIALLEEAGIAVDIRAPFADARTGANA